MLKKIPTFAVTKQARREGRSQNLKPVTTTF